MKSYLSEGVVAGDPVLDAQEQLDLWDMDESGEIEFVEFLKVVAYYKKKAAERGTNP